MSLSCRSCRFHRLHQQFLDKLSCRVVAFQQEQFLDKVMVFLQVPWSRQCIPSGGTAVAALQQGRLHPCRGAEFVPHGLADHRDSHVAVQMVVDVPVALVVRVPLVPSWR